MAKLHSKKKGKAGSKRPKSKSAPTWTPAKKQEVESIILKMAKEGVPASKIGLFLRDQHGVANVRGVLGNTIVAFLRKEKAAPLLPEDIMTLIKKALRLRSHLKSYKKDVHNKVKLGHVESKIQRLAKYYSKKGMIQKDWKYDPEQVGLLVK